MSWPTLLLLACLAYPVFLVPQSNIGPSGSTFRTASVWPNYELAAFADLNADREMDVILVDPSGKQLYASVAPSRRPSLAFGGKSTSSSDLPSPTSLLVPGLADPIRSVVPADFNGDSVVDLLILTSRSLDGPFNAYIAYGDIGARRGQFIFDPKTAIATFASQPLVCDLNADSIADVLGEVASTPSERLVILGGTPMSTVRIPYSGPRWSKLGYSAFGDVNGDTVPDILILVERDDRTQSIQLILRNYSDTNEPFGLSQLSSIDLPTQQALGLFTLADFDTDGQIELLLPACTSSDCRGSSGFYLYSFGKKTWSVVDVQWTPKGADSKLDWSLSPTPRSGLSLSSVVGPAVGDVDLDGHPDIALGLAYWNSSQAGSLPAVLLNQGVDSATGRLKLEAFLLPGSSLPVNDQFLKQTTLFYNSVKGALDIFVTSWNTATELPTVALLLQQMVNDFYFIKVNILNGLCSGPDTCSDNRLPYGLPVTGQRSSYSTEASSGSKIFSAGLIATQSCCGALQLPSILYGLGPFANYVERLTFAIAPNSKQLRHLSIPALVPNSEVFVNPYPLDDPDKWTAKLFLQPLYNMKVLYIAITLIAVCIVLIVIISTLLCLELREDRMEKQREAQRFHFDAM